MTKGMTNDLNEETSRRCFFDIRALCFLRHFSGPCSLVIYPWHLRNPRFASFPESFPEAGGARDKAQGLSRDDS
jgi:hypothetical protein